MFFASVVCWLVSVLLARANYHTLFQGFGVIASPSLLFTPLLWISLGLAALGILRSRDKESLVVIELIFLAVAFHFSLTLFQPNARVYDSYVHYGTAKALIETGHTIPADFSYQSWPGVFLWASIVTTVLNLPGDILLYSFPIYVLTTLTLALYVVARRVLRPKETASPAVVAATGSVVVFFAENNSLQTHFAPQAIGLVLTVFLAYALFSGGADSLRHSSESSYALIGILFFASITVSHPPSALLAMFVLAASAFLRLRLDGWNGLPKPALLVVCGLIFISWQVFEVYQFGATLRAVVLNLVVTIMKGLLEARYLRPALPREAVLSDLTILRHIFFFVVGLAGFYLILKRRDRLLAIVSAYGAGTALLFGLLVVLFRGFLWDRTLLFGAFAVALSVGYVLRESNAKTKSVLLTFVIAFLLINAYGVYTSEPANMIPTSEREAALFTIQRVQSRSFTSFVEGPLLFDDPFYVQRNVQVFNIDEFALSSFARPDPGVCNVIISGQLRILVGDTRFLDLTAQMNRVMNRYYSSSFDVSYSVIGRCG